MCVRARACGFVCVCVYLCVSVRKIVNIRSSLKYIPLFDAIHTSLIVATHVIDYDSPESQSDVDYDINFINAELHCSSAFMKLMISF